MKIILIANLLTIAGQLVALYASSRKEKNKILIFQIVSMFLMSSSSLLLKGYSAIVMDLVAICRNVLSIYQISFKGLPYLFIALAIIFGVSFNNLGILGLFPIIGNVVESLVVLNPKTSAKQLKLVFSFAGFCWMIYNFVISSYAGALFDGANALSYLYNAYRNESETKKGKKQ